MRLHTIDITNVPPVHQFSVTDLADVIVVAGPNGVGKTRLVQAVVDAFRSPGSYPNIRLVVQATTPQERVEWGREQVDTVVPQEAQALAGTIQRNRKRTHWESSVFQFESDRANPQYHAYQFSWDASDPWEELIGWDWGLNSMRNRYQDTISSLFRKVHSQRDAVARRGLELIRSGGGHLSPDEFPDPIAPFKRAFRQLLAPKELLDPEPRDQTIYFQFEGSRFPLNALSSGEREVVNIAFDFLLRDPSDSIIVFDEPELHLHPELSYKLLHTLRSAGVRNQFVFITHSPDIITASLEHSVVFVSPPKGGQNQAVVVREDDATNEALHLIGQSIGIVSLGKRIVLIEGARTSLDKQTYGAILKDRYPNLVLVPSGGKGLIQSFHAVVSNVLSQALWGVDFFMLCDRDSLPIGGSAADYEARAGGRLRMLDRYHLENYFLEEEVLAQVFKDLEPAGSWLRDPLAIRARLEQIATTMVPYAVALTVSSHFRERYGNVDLIVKGCHGKNADELSSMILQRAHDEASRFGSTLLEPEVEGAVRATFTDLQASVSDGTWKARIPGKVILEQFAGVANLQSNRLKLRYLAEAERHATHPFQHVIDIFADFSQM